MKGQASTKWGWMRRGPTAKIHYHLQLATVVAAYVMLEGLVGPRVTIVQGPRVNSWSTNIELLLVCWFDLLAWHMWGSISLTLCTRMTPQMATQIKSFANKETQDMPRSRLVCRSSNSGIGLTFIKQWKGWYVHVNSASILGQLMYPNQCQDICVARVSSAVAAWMGAIQIGWNNGSLCQDAHGTERLLKSVHGSNPPNVTTRLWNC